MADLLQAVAQFGHIVGSHLRRVCRWRSRAPTQTCTLLCTGMSIQVFCITLDAAPHAPLGRPPNSLRNAQTDPSPCTRALCPRTTCWSPFILVLQAPPPHMPLSNALLWPTPPLPMLSICVSATDPMCFAFRCCSWVSWFMQGMLGPCLGSSFWHLPCCPGATSLRFACPHTDMPAPIHMYVPSGTQTYTDVPIPMRSRLYNFLSDCNRLQVMQRVMVYNGSDLGFVILSELLCLQVVAIYFIFSCLVYIGT